jgi:hypothetical protein
VHYHELARVIHEERQLEIERRLRWGRCDRPPSAPRSPWRSVRQAVGRLLIRVGSAIAAEAHNEAARLAPPNGLSPNGLAPNGFESADPSES